MASVLRWESLKEFPRSVHKSTKNVPAFKGQLREKIDRAVVSLSSGDISHGCTHVRKGCPFSSMSGDSHSSNIYKKKKKVIPFSIHTLN